MNDETTADQVTRGTFLRRLMMTAAMGVGIALIPAQKAQALADRCCKQPCGASCPSGQVSYECGGSCGETCCICYFDMVNECFDTTCPCG